MVDDGVKETEGETEENSVCVSVYVCMMSAYNTQAHTHNMRARVYELVGCVLHPLSPTPLAHILLIRM